MKVLVTIILSTVILTCGNESNEGAIIPQRTPLEVGVVETYWLEAGISNEVCFTIQDGVTDWFPNIETTLIESGKLWEISILVESECDRTLTIDDIQAVNDQIPYAQANVNGITLSRQWIEAEAFKNIGMEECLTTWLGTRIMLSSLLTHELGHILGLPDTENSSDAMYAWIGKCSAKYPTKVEVDSKSLPN